MTNRRNDPKGDRRTRPVQEPQVSKRSPQNSYDAHVDGPSWLDPAYGLELDLLALLARQDGWMRMTMPLDSKHIYLKYKLTSMRYPNHYVMTSGPMHELPNLIHQLRQKLELVDAGSLKPTEDRYFTPNQ